MKQRFELQNFDLTAKERALQQKFSRLILGNPPGVCPISTLLAFLQSARSQTCGKCVPCRDGLEQAEMLLRKINDGEADMKTFEELKDLTKTIMDTADCAIGYENARVVYEATEIFKSEFISHIENQSCTEEVGQKIPCISFCPAHVNIPGYISLIMAGRHDDAINVIRQENPFPTVCAFICEHPCEEKCRRSIIDSPINIRGLKKYAVDQVAADKVAVPKGNVLTGKHVAVIGGGPSGLTAAYYLSLMGHKVTVYEMHDKLGGMLRYGIPNYRLPKDRLDQDINAILSTGNIEVVYNCCIGKDITAEEIEQKYEAVYIAIGAQAGKQIPLEGQEAKGVMAAVDMLGEIGDGKIPDYTGKSVVVVGGGNVAMDCARSAIRCNAKEVTLVYRRRQVDMTALPSEIQSAIEEGAELFTQNAPLRVVANEKGEVCAFEMQPQIISFCNSYGQPGVRDAKLDRDSIDCDIVLMATGQDIVYKPFEKYALDPRRHTFITECTTRVKGSEKVFAGGDCAFGPSTVIKAIAAGKIAAINIDKYMGYHHKVGDSIDIPYPEQNQRKPLGRVNLTEIPARKRKHNFEPVEYGMTDEEAMQECSKCLRCDHFGVGTIEGGSV